MPTLRSTTLFRLREWPPSWSNYNVSIMRFFELVMKRNSEPPTTVIRHLNGCLILRSTTLFRPRERPPWWYNHNATIMTFVELIVKRGSEPLTTVIRHPNGCLSFDQRCYFVLGSSCRGSTTIMPL